MLCRHLGNSHGHPAWKQENQTDVPSRQEAKAAKVAKDAKKKEKK